MIFFSGHIANWEIAMLAGVQYGIPVAQIYRAGNNPLLDHMITRFRGDESGFIPKGRIAVSNGTQSGPRVGMEKGPLFGIGSGLSR